MNLIDNILDGIGGRLAKMLTIESSGYQPYTPSDYKTLCKTLRPGDILLVEGNQHISAAIKYLTQSTWSHAAIYVGDVLPVVDGDTEHPRLVEVNLGDGCIAVPLSKYQSYNTRICRPVGLTKKDRDQIVNFMVTKIGLKYDLKNIFDLLRYFFPTPPVPVRWRRRMLSLGSSSPTKAICSSLIAQAYQSVKYPILPEVTQVAGRASATSAYSRREILHIRHHSLFVPRDFDLSPYFEIIKPTLQRKFNYRDLSWSGKVSQKDILRNETDETGEGG